MPRLAGIDIPAQKQIYVALTYVHGVGRTTALKILEKAGITPEVMARDLTEDELSRLVSILDKDVVVEGQLRRQVADNVSRLRKIGAYRGLRHRLGLPVHGQRTRSNARTRKGPKKTVAGKRAARRK